MMRILPCVMALLMFACGGGGKSSDDATGDSTEAPTTGAPTTEAPTTEAPTGTTGELSGCACFELGSGIEERCPQPEPCAQLNAACPDDQKNCELVNPAALDCLLATIAGDAPGAVEWVIKFPDSETLFSDIYTTRALNFGDGTVFWTQVRYVGIASFGDVERHELASLALAGCPALPDASARFDCLQAAFAAEPAEVCIDNQLL